MSNSSWSWRNSTFSKISKIRWWGATTKNWKISANRKNNHWSLRIRQFWEKNFFWKKIFKIEIANVIFRPILNKSENIFWSIAQIERGFQKLDHLVTKIVCLKIFEFLKVTVKIYVNSRLVSAPRPKISNLLRLENGFEIRHLHHFESIKVSHNISQILRVTEIQQFTWNKLVKNSSIILKCIGFNKIVSLPERGFLWNF